MSDVQKKQSRREFIKTIGVTGITSVLASTIALAKPDNKKENRDNTVKTVPKRPFGKTGEKVSILALGGDGNFSDQLMMRQAIKWGVTLWDTWDSDRFFGGGLDQKGVGKYFKQNPDDRKKVFIISKSDDNTPESMNNFIAKAIKEMNIDSIDFFIRHGISNVENLNPKLRDWVDKAKSEGKIRYFGLSSHKNMEDVMLGASRLGWIDGVMVTYNYRLMQTDKMKQAVDACRKSGLAVIAMKTQANTVWTNTGKESETSLKLTDTFIKKGYTLPQAKLKAVWQNPYIASITSMMLNMTILKANIDAALDRTKFTGNENELFKQYANETACNYCDGCAGLCESVLSNRLPVSDVMRYLMYASNYEDRGMGKRFFNRIPQETRRKLLIVNYSAAEKICSQKMPIARLMKEAFRLFA